MNADKFLRDQKIMRLGTVSKDGVPHVVPVWYSYDGKKFRIGTNMKTAKIRNIRSNKRVAYCIDREYAPQRSRLVRGMELPRS